jgi:predicted nucleotidyltransferase
MIQDIHKKFLEHAISILKKDSRILGVTVGGSYITQTMDEYSDLDLTITITNEHYQEVINDRISIAESVGELLSGFTGEHVGEPRLLICYTVPNFSMSIINLFQ